MEKNPEKFSVHSEQPNFEKEINTEIELPSKFDALVVLGKVWKPSDQSRAEKGNNISLEGKMRTLAAGEMFQAGLTDKIIFSGGKTAGKDWNSEAGSMRKYLKKKFPEIPDSAVLLEEESFDTPENAEKTKEILTRYGFNQIALLTNEFHLERAKKLFENQDLIVHGFPAEEFLKNRTSQKRGVVGVPPNYEHFIERYLGSKINEPPWAYAHGILAEIKLRLSRIFSSLVFNVLFDNIFINTNG